MPHDRHPPSPPVASGELVTQPSALRRHVGEETTVRFAVAPVGTYLRWVDDVRVVRVTESEFEVRSVDGSTQVFRPEDIVDTARIAARKDRFRRVGSFLDALGLLR